MWLIIQVEVGIIEESNVMSQKVNKVIRFLHGGFSENLHSAAADTSRRLDSNRDVISTWRVVYACRSQGTKRPSINTL